MEKTVKSKLRIANKTLAEAAMLCMLNNRMDLRDVIMAALEAANTAEKSVNAVFRQEGGAK